MMTPAQALTEFVRPTLKLMGAPFHSPAAEVHLLAIGNQESDLVHLRQLADGPARGLFGFEPGEYGGVAEAIRVNDMYRQKHSDDVMARMGVTGTDDQIYESLEWDLKRMVVMARLLAYGHPDPLPTDGIEGWKQYIDRWHPGAPRKDDWPENWARADLAVRENTDV